MSTTAIITVVAADDTENLHPDDAEVAGVYAVALGNGAGDHPPTPRNPISPGDDPLVEAALDVFHDRITISVLDQFEISVNILANDEEGPQEVHWL